MMLYYQKKLVIPKYFRRAMEDSDKEDEIDVSESKTKTKGKAAKKYAFHSNLLKILLILESYFIINI